MTAAARILIACEFSGIVRRAFAARGFDAWSCDLLPAEDRSNHHITGDVRDIMHDANARLIAAAPALLEALEGILPSKLVGESLGVPDAESVTITTTYGQIRAARAAIRAAGSATP